MIRNVHGGKVSSNLIMSTIAFGECVSLGSKSDRFHLCKQVTFWHRYFVGMYPSQVQRNAPDKRVREFHRFKSYRAYQRGEVQVRILLMLVARHVVVQLDKTPLVFLRRRRDVRK